MLKWRRNNGFGSINAGGCDFMNNPSAPSAAMAAAADAATGRNNLSISFVFITYNEEKNIGRALESVKEVADEIIILDSGSADKTLEIASNYGAKIYHNKFSGFAAQKNLAVSYARKDYIFVLDADEELTPGLKEWISDFKTLKLKSRFYEAAGFYAPRKSSFIGRWINYSGWFPDYTLRLIKRGAGAFKKARVHESLEVNGAAIKIDSHNYIRHYTYDSLEQYFDKFNSYTSLAARDLLERGAKPSAAKILINPLFSFLKQYFIKRGFLDGFHGLILAILSAFYVFVKYCKLYFLARAAGGELNK